MKLRWIALVLLLPTTVLAEPLTLEQHALPATYDVGFRIGGYGFRREGDPRPGDGWNQCRMNGVGMFASRSLHGPLFVEAGLDAYTSSNLIMGSPSTDLPIDRTSGLLSVAGGARVPVTSWLRAYVQLGIGVELTRVSVPYNSTVIRDDKLMPEGFFGVGGEVKVLGAYFGASLRTLVMGNFAYDPAKLNNMWAAKPEASTVFAASPSLAAQGQFYIRHDL